MILQNDYSYLQMLFIFCDSFLLQFVRKRYCATAQNAIRIAKLMSFLQIFRCRDTAAAACRTAGKISPQLSSGMLSHNESNNKIVKPCSRKDKYCPPVAAIASAGSNNVAPSSEWHFVNPGQLVQAASCTQEARKENHVTLSVDLWPMTLF